MSNVITNPISNIPVNVKSHVKGWSLVWQEALDAAIDHKCTPSILDFDTVYIDHGANYTPGTLNLFGGANDELFQKVNRVLACKHIVSLDCEMPQWGELLRKRIGAKTTSTNITEEWCDQVTKRLANVECLKQEDLSYDSLTIGDSHTIAFSKSNQCVLRNDGKTLFGSMRGGFSSLLRGKERPKQIIYSFGSIDIRHHILRREGFDVDAFVSRYVEEGRKHADSTLFSYPVPVEFEGRKIPKTGFYKKTPFFGTEAERRELTEKFIAALHKYAGDDVVAPPQEWYTMDSEQYAKTYMEFGSSFHIAPPFYHRKNWGQGLGA